MSGRARKNPSIPLKARLIGKLAAMLLRCVNLTLRLEVNDPRGVLQSLPQGSMIWAFWHNRIFSMPAFWQRFIPSRQGAVLTSASKDGAILAAAMESLGVSAVRGSSSRRGGQAMMELRRWLEDGFDVAITPDGPRGPCYRLAPGLVKLASVTGAAILPIRLDYDSVWRLKSWDRFQVPKPFSKVVVTVLPLEEVPPGVEDESLEGERHRIEQLLGGDEVYETN